MNAPSAPPPIAVVIPAYTGAIYLRETIASVLAQTVPVQEVLVVDDGSADQSANLAEGLPKTRIVRQANTGVGGAFNFGVAETTAPLLAFLDHDDLWTPDRIERQLPFLLGSGDADLVLGHIQNFHSPDLLESERQRIHCPPQPLAGYVMGTMLIRRETFLRVGPLKTDWKIGCHIEWLVRAQDLGLKVHMLPEVILKRRLHRDNLSRREMASRPDFARVLKLILDRRRERKFTPDLV
jgi:glycosyltransferase involved in cell wall biosynthesis